MIRKILKDKLGILPKDFEKYLKRIDIFGFNKFKLEKDFYLTIVLGIISKRFPKLIFKGGTCLNKVYLEYFRLSEDLDFDIILTGGDGVRRRTLKIYVQEFKEELAKIGLTLKEKPSYTLKNNTRLKMDFMYTSMIDATTQEIKIEISIKDKKYLKPTEKKIKSIFIDPFSGDPIFEDVSMLCIDFKEAIAEKMRAALTRTAIRDFFDIRHIKESTDFVFEDIRDIIAYKLKESQYAYKIDTIFEILEKQIHTHLKQVLGEKNKFGSKELREVYDFILTFKIDHT